MTGRIISVVLLSVMGVWFLASAMTEKGLLPSGHGIDRSTEIVIGAGCLIMAILRVRNARGRKLSAQKRSGNAMTE